MSDQKTTPADETGAGTVEELRQRIFESKDRYRRHLAHAPIEEKLRILEEMRDFTASLEHLRAENKARVKGAWLTKSV